MKHRTEPDHERFEELVALDLYDELNDGERRELAGHLERCARCRVLRDELRGTLGALRDAPPTRPSEHELARGLERLQRMTAEERATPARRARTTAVFFSGLAAGLALALFVPAREESSPGATPPDSRRTAALSQAASPTDPTDPTDHTVRTTRAAQGAAPLAQQGLSPSPHDSLRGPRAAPFHSRPTPPPRTRSHGLVAALRVPRSR